MITDGSSNREMVMANETDDNNRIAIGGMMKAQQRVHDLESILERRSVLDMLIEIFQQKISMYVEVLLFICVFYYVDVILDIMTMAIFYHTGDPMFFMANLTGIALGVVFSLVSMIRQVDDLPDSRRSALALGFLMPAQLHVLYLSVISIYNGQKHVLLYSAKLAESVVEATISALVQTYAVIFRSSIASQNTVYWSIALSYCSIGFAFTTFDRATMGLLGLPGASSTWDRKLILVFACRVCEVTSRITSLAIFQRATRNKLGLGVFGIAVAVSLDGMIMLVLLVIYQGFKKNMWKNVLIAMIPSAFCSWNQLLEQEVTYGIPVPLYYTVRAIEWVLFALIAMYGAYASIPHPQHLKYKELVAKMSMELYSEFPDDAVPICAFFASTLGLAVLLPIIRMCFAGRLMLRYSGGTMAKGLFDSVAKNLRDQLLDFEGAQDQCDRQDVRDFHKVCHNILSKAIERLEAGRPEDPKTSEIDFDDPVWNSNAWDRQVRTPLAKILDAHLYEARNNLHHEYLSTKETMRRMVNCAYNLLPYLKGVFLHQDCGPAYQNKHKPWIPCALDADSQDRQNELYIRYLRVVGDHLKEQTIQDDCLTRDRLPALLSTMPGWLRFQLPNKKAAEMPFELRLYGEKRRIISLVAQGGRKVNGKGFDKVIKDIFEAVKPQCRSKLQNTLQAFVSSSSLERVIDMLLGEQMLILLHLLNGTGSAFKCQGEGPTAEFAESAGIAMVEGAVAMFKKGSGQSEDCFLNTRAQCDAMKQALQNSLTPQSVQNQDQQKELDKLGFYGLASDIRRATQVADRPVKTPEEATRELSKITSADNSKRISVTFTSTFALDAAPEKDDERGHGALISMLGTVGEKQLKALGVADAVCQQFNKLRDDVEHKCLDDLRRMEDDHWATAQRLDPLHKDSLVGFKKCWEKEQTETLFKTERDKHTKETDKFEKDSQKKWTLFLDRTKKRCKWSQTLRNRLIERRKDADEKWREIQHKAVQFWQEKQDDVLSNVSHKQMKATQAQQDQIMSLASDFEDARRAQHEAERQKREAERQKQLAEENLQSEILKLERQRQLVEAKCGNLQAENSNLRDQLEQLQAKSNPELKSQSAGFAKYPGDEGSSHEPLLSANCSEPDP